MILKKKKPFKAKVYKGKYTKSWQYMLLKFTLIFINFLIKTIDKSYSNFELYLNFKI